jgi:hypothetical protein
LTVPLRACLVAIGLIVASTTAFVQGDHSLEYQVKAAYLYNFVKYVQWPARAASGPISICIAGRTPLAAALTETIRGESVDNRTLAARTITEPDAACSVLFVADGVAAEPYLRAVRGTPTLTVGESTDFLRQGGMIAFVLEDGKVRFDINIQAPERADLKISSRVLRLARAIDREPRP